jgi:microcystin degradation protein MlrC
MVGSVGPLMGEPTVLVGSVAHESNTFSSELTERPSFREQWEYFGEEMDRLAGTNTGVGGVVDFAAERDVELVRTVAATATPGGPVARETFDFYLETILEAARERRAEIDGVVLPLHGAMVVEGIDDGHDDDGEGPLIAAVRDVVGPDVPIVVTLDLHGNVTDRMVDRADALVSYETYPHVDMAETGRRGTRILLDAIDGVTRPVTAIERPPMLTAGVAENTSDRPMKGIVERARDLEDREGVVKVNVMPGFFRSDIPSASFSVSVVGDGDATVARDAARELARVVWSRRAEFETEYPEPAAGVARARELAADLAADDGPVVLADYGDNPGGGGTNDETAVLREMIDQDLSNAGFAFVRDPDAVATCLDAGVGEWVTLTLGGKSPDSWTDPIENLTGYVKAVTDGEFTNTGPMRTGTVTCLGRTVLLRCGPSDGVHVVVAENRLQPLDPELWRHVGLSPESLDVIAVKSANHYRAAYEPIASHLVPVDSPGLNVMDPRRYPGYSRIRRPMFPLDPMEDADYPDW